MIKKPFLLPLAVVIAALGIQTASYAQPLVGSQPGLRAPRLSAAPGGASSAQRQADYIVAVVNSDPITNNEVQVRAARLEQQLAQQGGQRPSHSVVVQQVLERLILEKAALQQAKETGIKIDDVALNTAIDNVAEQNQISREELFRRIAADNVPVEQFRSEIRNQLTLAKVREREVSRVRVTDADIDDYIREQAANAPAAPADINLAQVLISVPESASPAEVAALSQRAQMVADRARKGDDFAALAQEFSQSAERSSGGVMGLRAADKYPELFANATRGLNTGDIAGPIRSGAGFHVLKVVEKVQTGVVGSTIVQTHPRHILLRLGAQITETAARERLADIKRRIESKQTDFATVAKEISQDGSAKDGGDLGWVSPGQFVPEFESVMEGLPTGQISDPVTSRFGVHLIEVIERRTKNLTQREQRDLLRGTVREKKQEEAYNNWTRELRARAYVDMREAPQ